MFFKIGVLKNFAIFTENTFFKNAFFYETPPVAASDISTAVGNSDEYRVFFKQYVQIITRRLFLHPEAC